MAKIYGLFGSMTGKLADTVMSVRNGEQIARKYQPVVFNPSTPAQIEVRAKLKLLSQLSAVMAPVIAFRKQGAVSSRNMFTKNNYRALTYTGSEADVTLTDIKLTAGVVSLPRLELTRESSSLTMALDTASPLGLSRVCYAVFRKQIDGTLRLLAAPVVQAASDNLTFSTDVNLEGSSAEVVVYAYGVRDNTEAARVVFGNLTAPLTQTVAKLIVTSSLTESDVTLTETVAAVSVPSA